MNREARTSSESIVVEGRRSSREIKKPGRPGKGGRKPYDLEMVVDAAIRVFNRRGFEASSMEDVARETGLTKSSLYYHVASKEELLGRALERAFTPLLAILDESEAKSGTPIARLKHIVYRSVLITVDFAQEVELLQRIKGNTSTERNGLEWRRRMDHAVTALVGQAASAGELRSDIEHGLLTRLIFGMSNSITQWYRAEGNLGRGEIAAAVLATVFEGLGERRVEPGTGA
jgi:AcrR family transcriptional regulator